MPTGRELPWSESLWLAWANLPRYRGAGAASGSHGRWAHLHMISVERLPYLNGLSQEVTEGRHDGLADFTFGLDLNVAGLAALRIQGARP